MAWRIQDHVVRLIMDNRIPGFVTGAVWLAGRNDPLQLNLVGNPWRDMAGCVLTLENPGAVVDRSGGLATEQRGVCGDLTASRKVKIPTVSLPEWVKEHPGEPFPYVWGNTVYLEWFSERNGRVVIELHGSQVHLSEPSWHMSPEEEQAQRRNNADAMDDFMRRLTSAGGFSSFATFRIDADGDKAEGPQQAANDQALEQRIRIETLKEKVRDLVGGQMLCGEDENAPLDLIERFWQNVLEFEENSDEGSYPNRRVRDLLAEDGVHPCSPDQVLDEELEAHLERLTEAMARRGLLLCQTDHLSDRELYTLLVERVLESETEAYPIDSGWYTHLEISELGIPDGENGTQVFLRYYADESDREEWSRDFPDTPVPPHEDPPYDRDRWLPRP